MNATEGVRLLNHYPVIKKLPQGLLRKLDETVKSVKASAGQRLFDEGSPCNHYPLLIEGVIRATKCGPDGHEILLYRLNPGESCVVTVLALLGETTYSAIGTAETKLSLFGVPRNVFIEMVLKCPAFRAFVFGSLSRRLAHLMALIDDVAFRRVDQRLAARLLRDRQPITATHKMLADELGTTREVVSRILEGFQRAGLLSLSRKRVEVLDYNALARAGGIEI